MKLIQDNPYRIAGILANASERDVVRQKSKISKSAGIGRQVDSELDFPFMNTIDRTDLNSANKAFSGIEQNQDKVSHSLFWFLKANTFDETAINYLINGDKEKAVEIWDKVTNGKEVTSKNFSCFNNIGTLKLLSDSQQEIKEGLEAKIKLIESPNFSDFVHTVADQTYTIDNQKQAEKFVDDVLKQLKGKYSTSDTLKLFSNCNGTTKKYLSQKFTEEPLHKIESQIEQTRNKRKNSSTIPASLGLNLHSNCKDEIITLKSLLGQNDLTYMMVADNLAKEILQCGIDYFVDKEQDETYVDQTISILEKAKSICVNQSTLDRIDENINELKNIKFAEIQYIIEVVRSVKDAINNLGKENKGKSFYEQQTINKQKVDEILNKEVSSVRIQKLIESKNKTYIDEFIALSTTVRDKLSTTGIKRIIDLLVKTLPNNHEFIILERARQKKLEDDSRRRKADDEARKKREAEREAKRREEQRENERKEEIDNIAGYISIGLGVIAGLIVLGWATSVGEEFYGFIMGAIFGFFAGRIVAFVAFLPCLAIARIFYALTR